MTTEHLYDAVLPYGENGDSWELAPAELVIFDDPEGFHDAEWDSWTQFPLLREAIAEELSPLGDEELHTALAAEGFDAEALEDFIQVLGDIGRAVGNALPAIGTGAATGATVGSIVPGLGTGVGAAVGGVLGGLSSILAQVGSQPSRPGQPVRPGVARTAGGPPPRPQPTTTPPQAGSQPQAASGGASAMQQLLALLASPQVIQALTALALGPSGRPAIPVAGREVPSEAFAELVGELATQTALDTPMSEAHGAYLLTEEGEAAVDLSSPAERAGALIGLLAADALGEELPPPRTPPVRTRYDHWQDDDAGDANWDQQEWGDAGSADVGSPPFAPEADEAEGAPAFVAAAGALISGAQLGLAVFQRIENPPRGGTFAVTASTASYIHPSTPAGLTVQTRTFAFAIYAHHPRPLWGTQEFHFLVDLNYDGLNIRRASIIEDRNKSSTLTTSKFDITFSPGPWEGPTASGRPLGLGKEPVAAIVYSITGRWDPHLTGDEVFHGKFILDAQGTMSDFEIKSGKSWVRPGTVTAKGGGRVPRPTRTSHVTSVSFDPASSSRLTTANIRHLHAWYRGLPAPVKTEIQEGRLPIVLAGRTSTTGSVPENQRLGRARAEAVAATLRDFAGSTAQINPLAPGELEASTPDSQEDPKERRVDVQVSYTVYR